MSKQTNNKKSKTDATIGILLAIFCVSIVYSTAVVVLGTSEELTPKIMVIPQALGALYIILKKFTS